MGVSGVDKPDLSVLKVVSPRDAPASTALRNLQGLLRPGLACNGTVIEVLPGEGVLLRLAGETVMARTEVALTQGTAAEFLVKETHPQIILKLIDHPPVEERQRGIFRQLLSLRGQTASVLEALTTEIEAATGRLPEAANNLDRLAGLWHRILLSDQPDPQALKLTGLGWEGRLKAALAKGEPADLARLVETDLKGLAMQTLSALSEKTPESALGRALTSLLHLIEGYQAANTLLSSYGEDGVFFPVWFSGGAGWGECEILLGKEGRDEDGSAQGGEERFRALFFLDMSRLGPIRINLQVSGRKVNCLFVVSDKERQEYLTASLPELKGRLADSGFSVLSVECATRDKDQIEAVSGWFEALGGTGRPLLHIVI